MHFVKYNIIFYTEVFAEFLTAFANLNEVDLSDILFLKNFIGFIFYFLLISY